MTSVGVVIPTYNSAPLVPEAVESALAQEPSPHQVVVVDDGSTDDTASVLRRYVDRVEYIRQPNRGPSAARNAGLGRLRTDTVVFLDADDLLLAGALACRLALLEDGGGAWGHTEGLVQDPSGARRPLSKVIRVPPGGVEGRIFGRLLCRNFITVNAVIIRREALREVGGFDEAIRGTEDWDLWLRLALRYPIRHSPEPTFVYRRMPHTLSADRPAMDRARYQTLVKIHRLFPQEVAAAGSAARRSVADAHNCFGYALVGETRWHDARPYLWTSVRLWPWQRRAWGLLLRCLVPSRRSVNPPERRTHGSGPNSPGSSAGLGGR